MVALVLGLQLGWTKYCCFLCEWDSRDRKSHYIRTKWPDRESLTPGKKNVIAFPLAERDKICLRVLHIKLGLMKNFVKGLQKDGAAFEYLKELFPGLSAAKIKEGVFVGPQIRKIVKHDKDFRKTLNDIEQKTWDSVKAVFSGVLGSKRSPKYKELVEVMLTNLHEMGCNMSLKIHYLHSHLTFLGDNSVDVSDEHGERFHQDVAAMEKKYHGKSIRNMLADYCWTLISADDSDHKRQSSRISFQNAETVKRRKIAKSRRK